MPRPDGLGSSHAPDGPGAGKEIMTLPADDERYTYADITTEPYSDSSNLVRGKYWGTSVSYRYGDNAETTINVYHVDYDAPAGVDIIHHDLNGKVFNSYPDDTPAEARKKNFDDARRTLYEAGLLHYMRRR